ncbi:MAG TPA: RES family NAD+ phosphorylase [bacterium]|nr:RES family NAD+ phosphorylase [bacterium]
MTAARLMPHTHNVYRVLARRHTMSEDASYSQTRRDNRWNTPDFPALYACCSLAVARSVANDLFSRSGVVLEDLQPDALPVLHELGWRGELVDAATPAGLATAGLPSAYPTGVTKADTQRAASTWHAAAFEGVVCRSASLARLGFAQWTQPHEPWGEVAIFTRNAKRPVRRERTWIDLAWLRAPSTEVS